MPNCSVVGCDYSKWPKDGTYRSFPLPTEPNLRLKWLKKLNRDENFDPDSKSVSVCIRHFEQDAFVSDEDNKTKKGKAKKRTSLKLLAYPTLFLRPEKETTPRQSQTSKEAARAEPVPQEPVPDDQIIGPNEPIDIDYMDETFLHDHIYWKSDRKRRQEEEDEKKNGKKRKRSHDLTGLGAEGGEHHVGREETANPSREPVIALSHEMTIEQLKEHNEFLRQHLIDKTGEYEEKIRQHEEKEELLQKENDSLKATVASVKKIFNDDQMHRLLNPSSRSRWSYKTMQFFLALKTLIGPTAYEWLYAKGWPLAHINSIYNHAAKIECEPGILYDFLTLTEFEVATRPARDKYVALVMDEMSIKPKYVYNNHTQSFMGNPTIPVSEGVIKNRTSKDPTWDQSQALATHAFNAQIASLCARFKGHAGVEFTDNGWCPKAVAKWMKQLIQKIYDISLITKVIVMDMSGQNKNI